MNESANSGLVTIEWPVAWGDLDAFGHVNNTVYFRWFEHARLAFFERTGVLEHMRATGVGPILARTSCAFRVVVTWPDRVRLTAWAAEIGDDRFTMRYLVESLTRSVVVAEGDGRIVFVDYRAGGKSPIPPAIREAVARFCAPPPGSVARD